MTTEDIVARLDEASAMEYRVILADAMRADLIENEVATEDDVEVFDEEIKAIAESAGLQLMSNHEAPADVVPRALREARALFAGVDERRAELAGEVGEDVGRIRAHVMDFERMRRRGILVDVDVHGVSLLRQRASWAELGIPEGDIRRKRIHRGTKYLFPKYARAFNSLEARLHDCLKRYSFDLEGFRPYRFVPVTAYAEWKEEWQSLVDEWNEVKAELLDAYAERLDEERGAAAEVAVEAWDALLSRHRTKQAEQYGDEGGGRDEVAVVIRNQSFTTLDGFVEWVQNRATRRYPTKSELEHGLYPSYKTSMILAPGDLLADELRAERLQTQIAEEKAEQRAQMAKARTREEEERIRKRAMEARARAMYEAEMDRAREMVAQTVSPFREAFEQLRAQIHEDVLEIAASIEKNGYVRGGVAKRARRLQETFALLNAHDDDELAEALTKLKANLQKCPEVKERTGKTYDTEAVLNNLKAVEEMTHDAAQEVARRAQEPTSGVALDL